MKTEIRAAWHYSKVGSSLRFHKKMEVLILNLGKHRPVRRWKHTGGLPTANTGWALSNIPISVHCYSIPLYLSTHSNSAGPEYEFWQNSLGSSAIILPLVLLTSTGVYQSTQVSKKPYLLFQFSCPYCFPRIISSKHFH